MITPVSAVFASVLAVLFIVLGYRVSLFRLKHQKGFGHNNDRDFEAAVRAHANLAEYAPIALILLVVGELNGVSTQLVYWTGLTFVASRLLHAWGMYKGRGGPHKARLVGILLSWISILVMAGLVVWNVVRVNV
ncbi:MAPEG family protein [Marinobacter sp.]|uniref:MAPEG family protein n=1 Tax=Marinobacter sp. TaxID=50741 RepID=UPI00384B5929